MQPLTVIKFGIVMCIGLPLQPNCMAMCEIIKIQDIRGDILTKFCVVM